MLLLRYFTVIAIALIEIIAHATGICDAILVAINTAIGSALAVAIAFSVIDIALIEIIICYSTSPCYNNIC